ncbi:hypothetical protein [Limnoglobus roseus]|uniref:hypothetical protein n=1 Tax=Limnoglobus roseus TaxID=2598579 RepID=UPI0011EAFF3E|nr:hypothetical protein [Limnoglobus roseus]
MANAFDAIEECHTANKSHRVVVRVVRGQPPAGTLLDGLSGGVGPVTGFDVVDTGVGFTRENFDSFSEADSPRKVSSGGKGVGRLLWLKAFEKAVIESVYHDGAALQHRNIVFNLEHGVREVGNGVATDHSEGTLLRLVGLQPAYSCPQRTEILANRLIEHHLEQLLVSSKVQFLLVDEQCGVEMDLRKHFENHYQCDTLDVTFKVRKRLFKLKHYLVRGAIGSHQLAFCARRRFVTAYALSNHIRDLKTALKRPALGEVFYFGMVTGKALNEWVNETRSDFNFASADSFTDEPTGDEILARACQEVRGYLTDDLSRMRTQKQERIRNVVASKAPEMRAVVNRHEELVDSLAINASETEILTALAGRHFADRDEMKQLHAELMKLAKAGEMLEAGKKRLIERYASAAQQENLVALGAFTCHRKAVVDVLTSLLSAGDDGTHQLEEAVHQIIFPLRKTSDGVSLDHCNLWLIDERLNWHRYLASDTRADKLDPINPEPGKEGKEPDIIVFHEAYSTSETTQNPVCVTIIEFKRPGREAYDDDENPHKQIKEYAKLIRRGKARDHQGRMIPGDETTRFFGFIVADMTEKLRRLLKEEGYKEQPNGALYSYEEGLCLQIETLTYAQMLDSATRRNRAYFKQLGMPDL